MQLDNELISRLEKLARLQLSESERTQFSGDLTRILQMVDKLTELDTSGVEPLSYPTQTHQPLRADAIGAQLATEEALRNAPKHDRQFFRVPKFLD